MLILSLKLNKFWGSNDLDLEAPRRWILQVFGAGSSKNFESPTIWSVKLKKSGVSNDLKLDLESPSFWSFKLQKLGASK